MRCSTMICSSRDRNCGSSASAILTAPATMSGTQSRGSSLGRAWLTRILAVIDRWARKPSTATRSVGRARRSGTPATPPRRRLPPGGTATPGGTGVVRAPASRDREVSRPPRAAAWQARPRGRRRRPGGGAVPGANGTAGRATPAWRPGLARVHDPVRPPRPPQECTRRRRPELIRRRRRGPPCVRCLQPIGADVTSHHQADRHKLSNRPCGQGGRTGCSPGIHAHDGPTADPARPAPVGCAEVATRRRRAG